MRTTLINVSNRLPVTVAEKITKSSGGLVAALEGLSTDEYDLTWIGWPGGSIEEDERRREIEKVLTEEHGCIPVFLSEEEIAGHYEGFSNSSVWPLLHYMPNYMRYEPRWWDDYREVNQRFADKVLAMANPGDLVWVHDYQLMLVPQMLHERMPELRIGFFLHTPFPSFETFRCHPKRRELVAGMLGADLIGFHTFGYMRHFRSTVLRLLGLESEITRIRQEDGHTSAMGVFPIGINARKFDDTLDSEAFVRRRDEFREANTGKHVVLSVERMDYTKGILHRLDAIEEFLAHLEDRDSIKFIFVSVPSREEVEEYKTLREETEARIGHINGKYSTLNSSPIRFIHASVDFPDLCALYATADVGMVTPLVDGMNLVAKEYIACQRDNAGVLMLSEFAGAAEELSNALLVNPYDATAVAETLREALEMSEEEKRACNQPMRERVMKYDAQHWARSFIQQLTAAAETSHLPADEDPRNAATRVREALEHGQRVALFLDYDGTLRELEREPRAAKPTDEIRALLDQLRQRENVDLTLISGRTPQDLESWFGDSDIALIAEHGATIRARGSKEWEQSDRDVSYAWKEEIIELLRLYEQSTPGSFVEEKRTSLVWHHRKTDPEFGTWKANQLTHELGTIMANEPVKIRHGRKIVEVTSSEVSKGGAVRRLLHENDYAVVLCAGDDQTDESMFEIDAPNLLTIKVGAEPSRAKYRLRDPAAFRKFLRDAILNSSGHLERSGVERPRDNTLG
ncbi:MAG: bifunctional alpha,alpha-trehalose-phosphate synthase (UDP-forming)/trehalose-phosphatase [Verrucomicrobiota bacterium]|nr:bifunctional alpha,alpha-trehalose-phosphate synthase (UDP-forming)/trehalose-phosphatase [Verrucomicrobiota bacterium]